MLTLPKEFVTLMNTFAPLFTKRGWQHAQLLLVGAILAPGKRTFTAALRVMGLAQAKIRSNSRMASGEALNDCRITQKGNPAPNLPKNE